MAGYRKAAPSDARQIRSRNALSSALLELLQEKPFDQLTIREITARADTGYATFFRHYPTKEALLNDVASEEIACLLGMTIPLLDSAGTYDSTLTLCRYVIERRKLWSALLTGGASGIVREEFIRQARGIPREPNALLETVPRDLGVVLGTGGTIDLLTWWLERPDEYSAEQIAEMLDRLIIHPLAGRLKAETR